MTHPNIVTFEDPTGEVEPVLYHLQPWEVALHAVSRLAVVFALSLALILILAHQIGRPL